MPSGSSRLAWARPATGRVDQRHNPRDHRHRSLAPNRNKRPKDELGTLTDTINGMLGRLDNAFRAERALVQDVSHELRNPVAVIQTNVEAVLANSESTPAERREATAVVTRATGRMSRLLDDLLATARKRSTAYVDRGVDLAGLARSISAEYALLAAERSLQLDLRLASGPVVYADPASLDRALSNLLSNAVRLAPEGTTITVAAGSRQGWAWVAVRDEGPGIADEDRDRIFERFHWGSDQLSQGSGLEFTIARQIAESHHGRLLLAQRSSPGSTFVIWLPERAVAGAPERSLEPPDGDPLGRSAAETLVH
jgi:signal transduction histidine kinase